MTKKARSLLEFPGVVRTTVPEWRRELGERVRERRAREGSDGLHQSGAGFAEAGGTVTATLELLPQVETPEINPLVTAALRRIERARSQDAVNSSLATAFAYEEQSQVEPEPLLPQPEVPEETPKPERVHNLAVVPMPAPEPETSREIRKPVRVIGDQNDPALNYLDAIPTTITVETRGHRAASLFLRLLNGIADLVTIGLLAMPLLALAGLTTFEWDNPRVVALRLGTVLIVAFIYLTVSVAFTGRTLGMKLFSLRVVDARTGLIPTGSQSAGRAVIYILSLVPAGILLLLAFIDREKQALHDRLSRTAVVRV